MQQLCKINDRYGYLPAPAVSLHRSMQVCVCVVRKRAHSELVKASHSPRAIQSPLSVPNREERHQRTWGGRKTDEGVLVS